QLFFLTIPRPTTSPLFPYTTLFRSDQPITVRDDKGNPKSLPNGQPETTRYTRKRADGGTFTAEQALQYQLVDKIEDLPATVRARSEEHTSELQSRFDLVCRLLLEKK